MREILLDSASFTVITLEAILNDTFVELMNLNGSCRIVEDNCVSLSKVPSFEAFAYYFYSTNSMILHSVYHSEDEQD